MKKKYSQPELEIIRFCLGSDILTGSIERDQSSSTGGSLDDPPAGDDPLDMGGFL